MAVSGTVSFLARASVPNSGTRAWRVMVEPDTPTALAGGDGKRLLSLAFHIARPKDPDTTSWAVPPIDTGDRLTLPLLHGGQTIRVARADGSAATVRMIGWVFDPDAPLT